PRRRPRRSPGRPAKARKALRQKHRQSLHHRPERGRAGAAGLLRGPWLAAGDLHPGPAAGGAGGFCLLGLCGADGGGGQCMRAGRRPWHGGGRAGRAETGRGGRHAGPGRKGLQAGLEVDGMNKVYVIGIGPGGAYGMTAAARAALEEAEVICGYTVYLDLIAPLAPGKELRSTPMTRELDRCAMALELAGEGRTTARVCSGDAGVYGVASPLLELADAYPAVEVEVIPGVTAALAGAAVLGAPLGHDFCTVSLSDLLTPWQVIEKRLRAAVAGDFVL